MTFYAVEHRIKGQRKWRRGMASPRRETAEMLAAKLIGGVFVATRVVEVNGDDRASRAVRARALPDVG